MRKEEERVKVIYSSTNEKELKDVISALINTHEKKYNGMMRKAKEDS